MKFEDKIKELEEIIASLENGEVSLDESIEKYTKAMKLVKECDSELKNIEEKVNKIVTENGSLEDFETAIITGRILQVRARIFAQKSGKSSSIVSEIIKSSGSIF